MTNNYKYMVFTRCITYNHAPYIVDTLNGFCMQETTFPVVYCILDDASTDGEQEIIQKYLQENFNLHDEGVVRKEETQDYYLTFAQHQTNTNCFFALFLLKYNHNSIKKDKRPYYAEWENSSKYIAFCEGDDYWTDPHKMQHQVDYMEKHPDCGMTYTMCKYYMQDKNSFLHRQGGPFETFEDFIGHNNCVPTLTTMVRAELEKRYVSAVKPESRNWLMGDFPRWIWYSHESKVKFFPVETGVYRVLQNSASHSSSIEKVLQFFESTHDIFRFFSKFFNAEELYDKNLYYKGLFGIYFRYGDLQNAKQVYKEIQSPQYKEKIKYIISQSSLLYKHIGIKFLR